MGWNDGKERRKMKQQTEKDVAICRAENSPENVIEGVVSTNRDIYLNNRAESRWCHSIEPMADTLGSSKDDPYYMIEEWLDQKKPEHQDYPWLSTITCQELYDTLVRFTDDQLKIVEMIGIKKMKQKDAAEILGLSQGEISKEWQSRKNTIRACIPREISNRFRL